MRILNFFDGFSSLTTPLAQPIPATDILVYPTGNLTETNVQAALEGIYSKHIDKTSGVHGVIGDVVGTSDSQTLTNKLFGSALLPAATDTYSIGSGGNKWKHLYLSGNAYIDGSLLIYGDTAFFDTDALEFTGKVLTLNKNGTDVSAEGSGLYVAREGVAGSLIYDSSLASKWKAGNVGSEKEVVTVSDIQTLTNKTIDADGNTISNIADANIKVGAAIARAKLASGTANHVLINDGAGVMSSEEFLAKTRGGTGISSTATFPSSGIIVTRSATEELSNKTLYQALLSGGSLDISTAGTFAFLASLGANQATIGGATSTIVIPGNLTVQGTTTFIQSEELQVEDKNITCNYGGTEASMEGAGLTVDNTEGAKASFVYDSALASRWKCGLLGTETEIVTVSASQTLTNKTLSSAVYNGIMTGTGIKDEDNMASDSDVHTATQQSIKAYVDNSIAGITSTFLALTDTPSAYTSQAAKILTVNDDENAISFRRINPVANQTTVSVEETIITIGTAQDIHTEATPQFYGVKLTEVGGSNTLELRCDSSLTTNKILVFDTNDKSLILKLGTAEEGEALVYDATNTTWKPGASGDSSFKLVGRGTGGNDFIKIKGGSLRDIDGIYVTDNGTNNVWKSGIAVDIEYQIGATEIDSTPKANNTNYWLYINKTGLEVIDVEYTAGSATAFQAISVKANSFAYSKERPESGNVDLSKYIPIGYFRTDGSGNLETAAYSFSEVIPKVVRAGSGTGGGSVAIDKEETYNTGGAKTYTHNVGRQPDVIELYYFDGAETTPVNDESYINDLTNTQVKLDLSGLTFGSGEYLTMKLYWFQTVIALDKNEYESDWITDTLTTVFTHGIGKLPKGFTLIYDDNGTYKTLDHFSYISGFTTTQITLDFGTLIVDGTHRLKICCSGSSRPTGITVVIPSGNIMLSGRIVIPEGFLLCDGSSYTITEYPDLFDKIGYIFGGSGANFNVPNISDLQANVYYIIKT